jgi:hypothetical protein
VLLLPFWLAGIEVLAPDGLWTPLLAAEAVESTLVLFSKRVGAEQIEMSVVNDFIDLGDDEAFQLIIKFY